MEEEKEGGKGGKIPNYLEGTVVGMHKQYPA